MIILVVTLLIIIIVVAIVLRTNRNVEGFSDQAPTTAPTYPCVDSSEFDEKCGTVNGKYCKAPRYCSQWGWCGTSDEYVTGAQKEYSNRIECPTKPVGTTQSTLGTTSASLGTKSQAKMTIPAGVQAQMSGESSDSCPPGGCQADNYGVDEASLIDDGSDQLGYSKITPVAKTQKQSYIYDPKSNEITRLNNLMNRSANISPQVSININDINVNKPCIIMVHSVNNIKNKYYLTQIPRTTNYNMHKTYGQNQYVQPIGTLSIINQNPISATIKFMGNDMHRNITKFNYNIPNFGRSNATHVRKIFNLNDCNRDVYEGFNMNMSSAPHTLGQSPIQILSPNYNEMQQNCAVRSTGLAESSTNTILPENPIIVININNNEKIEFYLQSEPVSKDFSKDY